MAGFRHEWKIEINAMDAAVIRSRLRAVAKEDAHGRGGKYEIRSLYFDNLKDKALREKIDGVNTMEKFRIRYYNKDISLIKLEKKRKYNGLTGKESVLLSAEEVQKIEEGDNSFMVHSGKKLLT